MNRTDITFVGSFRTISFKVLSLEADGENNELAFEVVPCVLFAFEFHTPLFLDFQKAYGMLWIKGLLLKLDSLDARGNVFGFFRTYSKESYFLSAISPGFVKFVHCFKRHSAVCTLTSQGP